jgi:hypothetical protein
MFSISRSRHGKVEKPPSRRDKKERRNFRGSLTLRGVAQNDALTGGIGATPSTEPRAPSYTRCVATPASRAIDTSNRLIS